MALPTKTTQVRDVVTLDDAYQYRLQVTATDRGDLPSLAMFTIQIVAEGDPKEDVFARVAAVGDFETLSTDRVTAIAAGATLYRSTGWTFFYASIDTATAAQSVLKENIDTLVEQWRLYQNQFETVSEETEHPQLSPSVFMSLVGVYTAARTATTDAATAVTSSKTIYDTAETTASAAALEVTAAKDRWGNGEKTKNWFNTLQTQYSAFKLVVTSNTTNDPSVVAALQTATADLAQASTNYGLIGGFVQTLHDQYDAAVDAKTNADLAVASARTAYESAQAAYVVAQKAEEAALAAITTLKPSFDPANV